MMNSQESTNLSFLWGGERRADFFCHAHLSEHGHWWLKVCCVGTEVDRGVKIKYWLVLLELTLVYILEHGALCGEDPSAGWAAGFWRGELGCSVH